MPLEEPSWWYPETLGHERIARVLAPVGDLYGAIAARRYRRTQAYRSSLPVICVGNFTAGGTGKTPLSLKLAHLIKARAATPVFLSRGYGGTAKGPVWVDAERDGAGTVGDEPLLLARTARTLIARERDVGARVIEAGLPDGGIIIMDDGLQNASLAKDLSIAVVDANRGFGNGEVIPAGPLRAPFEFQAGLVDCIVVNGFDPRESSIEPQVLSFLRRRFPGPVLAAAPSPVGDTAWLTANKLVAFAGIGAPDRFFDMLERLGCEVTVKLPFADHAKPSEATARVLLAAADRIDGQLVTTEKDMARLAGSDGVLGELAARTRALPIQLDFDERDELRLAALLEPLLRRGQGAG